MSTTRWKDAHELLNDLDMLRHAVGASVGSRKASWGFRNHYATEANDDGWGRLVAIGFAGKGQTIPGGLTYFYVTPEGCRAIGFTTAQVKRACGDNK